MMIYIADKLNAYNLKVRDGKIFDPVRDKFVPLTPEEDVRQRMILYLLREIKVPADRIDVDYRDCAGSAEPWDSLRGSG